MSQQRADKGRGLFLTRDSLGRHEQTPTQYVGWAQAKAKALGVAFNGTPTEINHMIANGISISGDLFLDFNVSGNLLIRPALDALKLEIRRDLSVSHVFIPRRDRLARPDHAIDGVELENELRGLGVYLVFMEATLSPLRQGHRQEVGEAICAYIEYDKSGRYRDDLAHLMIFAQLNLAKAGFSTGGRAPFGFRRNLCSVDGTIVMELADGRSVRQKGHHVVWLPGPEAEIALIRRILTLLAEKPAQQVAQILNEEGIPSPDAGRMRRDNQTLHPVSGLWHPTTITNIARNPLIRALTRYGLRSMGDRRRMTPEGPRHIQDSDYREIQDSDYHKISKVPKVIRNPESNQVWGTAHCEPLIPVEQSQTLLEIIDKRGASQRGKPRSRNPAENPLGARIFDMHCGWPMYRIPRKDSFRYVCGFYQQAGGQACSHNHVEGVIATKFALAAVQQRLLKPGMMERLEAKLRNRIAATPQESSAAEAVGRKQGEINALRVQLATVEQNMALASTTASLRSIEKMFATLQEKEKGLAVELEQLKSSISAAPTPESQIQAALSVARSLPQLAQNPKNLAAIGQLFRTVNVQLYVRFESVKLTKRYVNKLSGGILTIGDVPPPITKYSGPTDRTTVRNSLSPKDHATAENQSSAACEFLPVSDQEDKSLGNGNRGDRI